MAESAVAAVRPPLWRNVRILRFLGQAVFIVVLVLVVRELYQNLNTGVRRTGQDLSFDFLQTRAGFSIKEGIEYSANESYLKAFLVGVVNTVRVSVFGIVLGSLLGLTIGLARLSPNWLLRKIGQVYVEVIRNTPVLIQIVFWYFGIVFALPAIGGGFSIAGVAFLSQRGTALPWLRAGEGFGTWRFFLLGALIAAVVVWRWRTRVNETTGRPHHRVLWSVGALIAVAGVGWLIAGDPIRIDVPEVVGSLYRGGLRLSPEFTAVLLGLTIYTAAFIAEIIRGSILAVDKGQKEAAAALGLAPSQQLRFVVLPQSLRIAIPPLNSQFQNLTKNSSLAVAVAFPELASISKTMINQAGRPMQIILIVMSTYLALNLTTSLFMNLLNRFVGYRGARR